MKDANYSKINEYYNKFREDKRLERRHGQIEFMTSMHFLEKYLKDEDRIADIGCGTGRYTFELAKKGYDVEAVEYSLANYRVLESNLAEYNKSIRNEEISRAGANTKQDGINICKDDDAKQDGINICKDDDAKQDGINICKDDEIKQAGINICKGVDVKRGSVSIHRGDARNLKMFEDDTFDVVILFGPLYHLTKHEDKVKALSEAKRIVKEDGVIFAAYIMNDYGVLYHGFIEGALQEMRDSVDEKYHIIDDDNNLYSYSTIEDIDRLDKECALISKGRFSQEGPSDYLRRTLNQMNDEIFEEYFRWHLSNCEKKELLGAGTHVVDIVTKN